MQKEPILLENTHYYAVASSYASLWWRLLRNSLRRSTTSQRYSLQRPLCYRNQIVLDRQQNTKTNIYLRNKADLCIAGQVYLQEDYSSRLLKGGKLIDRIYSNIVATGRSPLILDCGGNIGLASKYFSSEYPQSQILCVEPNAENVRQAMKNTTSPNIEVIEGGVGATDGYGSLLDPGLGPAGYRVATASPGTTRIFSVSTLLKKRPSATPFIIKIDIEGGENDLFSQETEWIDAFPVVIIELHDWLLPNLKISKNFLRAISKRDRNFFHRNENIFSVDIEEEPE